MAAGLFVSSTGIFNSSKVDYTKKMENNAIVGAVSRFGMSLLLFQKVQKTVEAQIQHIYRIVDVTVCYNTKTAIQTVWSRGGSSDSVVTERWTSLCDAKTGACVAVAGLLSRDVRISRIVRESRVSVRQKIHAGSSSNGSSLPAFAQILVQSSEPPQIRFKDNGKKCERLKLWCMVMGEPGYREGCMALTSSSTAAGRRPRRTSWFDLCTRRRCSDTGHFPFHAFQFPVSQRLCFIRTFVVFGRCLTSTSLVYDLNIWPFVEICLHCDLPTGYLQC